jgi:nucleoside phosphorylase
LPEGQLYQSLENFKSHVKTQHFQHFTETQLVALASVSQQPTTHLQPSACPICSDWDGRSRRMRFKFPDAKISEVSLKEFYSHVGEHMEQFALYAVSREGGGEEEEDEEEEDDSKGSQGQMETPLHNETMGDPPRNLIAYPNHDGYTVGWICTLPMELAAAMAMLDEQHQSLPQIPGDHNLYTLGRIGGHNVVIACLPAGLIGANPAARVASDMISTFKMIRFGLMVGIGGGVPSAMHDIRLGDVVVSKPGGQYGGVIQYDLGKIIHENRFVHTGSSNPPPTILLAALSSLQAMHMLERSRLAQYLSTLPQTFTYPGAEYDQLFMADYEHVRGYDNCEKCDVSQLVLRADRNSSTPVVHYGTIASGNQIIKHGRTRDRMGQEFNVLCFEMEAAGLMNNFPCVVIRGICDYADSHKNRRWQKYAAATAAAYAKELLSVVPVVQVANAPVAMTSLEYLHPFGLAFKS